MNGVLNEGDIWVKREKVIRGRKGSMGNDYYKMKVYTSGREDNVIGNCKKFKIVGMWDVNFEWNVVELSRC